MFETVNRVFLTGYIGDAPKFSNEKKSGDNLRFTLVTNESIPKGGLQATHNENHKIVMYGEMARKAAKMLGESSNICIEGKIHTYSFVDKEGIKRYNTEIVADRFDVLSN